MPQPSDVIEATGLTKRFGEVLAVDHVDLRIPAGTVYGILGPNGSGKSTTVRMLLGLARPDAGVVRLFGEALDRHGPALLRRVGSVVESPAFVPYLSGRDNLRLLDEYRPARDPARIERALERVHLEDAAHRRFKHYSLGMKQRLGIAAAILHDPELIVLDEPTNGLDPQGTREVRELIPELAREGRTVLLCSHLLHEVEQVCDAVAIFQRGRVVTAGAISQILGRRDSLEVVVEDLAGAAALLADSQWAGRVEVRPGALWIREAAAEGGPVNAFLGARGVYASVLRPHQPTLEEAFFAVTGSEGQPGV
ncbi:MAG: ABC transporter ATP-binding protein [Dehalococcoidia bacterium]